MYLILYWKPVIMALSIHGEGIRFWLPDIKKVDSIVAIHPDTSAS
jgi:hypothetical protein